MTTFLRRQHRAISLLTSAAVLGALVAGCAGGAGSPTPTLPAPKTPLTQGPAKLLGTIVVKRSNAATIARKVRDANAYASPIKGGRVRHLNNVKPMTSAAGNDLSNNGGPVMSGATVYNILVNAADETAWGGMQSKFETDLFASGNGGMINILDQYIGGSATGAYTYGGDVAVTYDTSQQLADQDIYNIVYQVAQQYGTGYNNIYNVFLDSTVTQCSQNAGGCYAQQYCAYHGNTDYSDIGHVIYSVEPYQGIQGCEVSDPSSPNGTLADSTASTSSHEMFEAFTDPDVPNNVAWYNQTAGEIGDICAPANGISTAVVNLNGDNWEIQPEYDNAVSDCSYTP